MTSRDRYPTGYLSVLSGLLLVMAANATMLTVRELRGLDLGRLPGVNAAVLACLLGLSAAAALVVLRSPIAGIASFGLSQLTGVVVAALVPGGEFAWRAVPWTFHLGFVGIVAAAFSLRGGWFAAYVVASLGSQWLLAGLSQEAAPLLLMCAVTAAAVYFVMKHVASIAAATQRAIERSRMVLIEQAEASAESDARERWNAWVHDHVLVALRLGAQREASAADHALQLLEAAPSQPRVASDLRAAVRAACIEHGIRLRWTVIDAGPLPDRVATSLHEAVMEAIRNVARHARASEVRISGEMSPTSAEIQVRDAGVGFDAGRRSSGLGIATSIVGQMTAAGGWAQVHSHPGAGTEVRVGWQAAAIMEPSLTVPLHWAVVAGAAASVIAATRAIASLGPEHVLWVAIGASAIGLLTGVALCWPNLSGAAALVWAGVITVLTHFAPQTAGHEGENWMAIGSVVLILAIARNRRERLGTASAILALGAQLLDAAISEPARIATEWAYWAQPAIHASLAWLGLALVGKMTRSYGDASSKAYELERWAIANRASRAERQRRMGELPANLMPLLRRLAQARAVPEDLARECRLAEAATRDSLTAPGLLTPGLAAAIAHLRGAGAYVSLSHSGPDTPPEELAAVRAGLHRLVGLVPPTGRLTVRWNANARSFASATIIGAPIGVDEDAGRRWRWVEVFRDPEVMHVEFIRSPRRVQRDHDALGGSWSDHSRRPIAAKASQGEN